MVEEYSKDGYSTVFLSVRGTSRDQVGFFRNLGKMFLQTREGYFPLGEGRLEGIRRPSLLEDYSGFPPGRLEESPCPYCPGRLRLVGGSPSCLSLSGRYTVGKKFYCNVKCK